MSVYRVGGEFRYERLIVTIIYIVKRLQGVVPRVGREKDLLLQTGLD
jgi:hypothetical protein